MARAQKPNLILIYVAAFAIAVLIASLAYGVTDYFSDNHTFANLTVLPRSLPIEATGIFNGYNEEVQLQANQSMASLRLHSVILELEGASNVQLTAALLYMAIFSIILFDYFSKELGYTRLYKYVGASAAALFCAFFISIIASQYLVSGYYYSNGGVVSGVSGFQVDSAATAMIFSSFTISSLVGIYQLRKLKTTEFATLLLICGIIVVIALGVLTNDLGFVNAGSLPEGSYAVHGFDLITFYAFFVITYILFSFLATHNKK